MLEVHNLLHPFVVSNYHVMTFLPPITRKFASFTVKRPLRYSIMTKIILFLLVFYAKSTVGGPHLVHSLRHVFTPESIFYTQTEMLSPRFIPLSQPRPQGLSSYRPIERASQGLCGAWQG